jgi:hypothetical protein
MINCFSDYQIFLFRPFQAEGKGQLVLRVLLKTGFSILDISGAIFFDHSGCIQV